MINDRDYNNVLKKNIKIRLQIKKKTNTSTVGVVVVKYFVSFLFSPSLERYFFQKEGRGGQKTNKKDGDFF